MRKGKKREEEKKPRCLRHPNVLVKKPPLGTYEAIQLPLSSRSPSTLRPWRASNMCALRLFVFAALALLCGAFADKPSQSCVANYGNLHGGLQPCGPISVSWVKSLAKNCTDGDLSSAYTALSAYCEEVRRERVSEHADMSRNLEDVPGDDLSRIVMRRASADTLSSQDSKVETREWQSSSSRTKHQSWAWKTPGSDGLSFSTIFAERSVRFALSGLLLTTLTSFIFL